MAKLQQHINAQSVDMNSNFSFDTISNFDDHIDMSIPNYSLLNEMICRIATYFIKDNSLVIDLGCSTGKLLCNLNEHISNASVTYVGYDVSSNLIGQACVSQFRNVFFKMEDITKIRFEGTEKDVDLFLSIFTLQFIQVKDRLPLLCHMYDALNDGGALIIAEKVYAESGEIQDILNFVHYDFKLRQFSADEILKKQYDLRKIMHPISDEDNLHMLKCAGFSKVFPFWQSLLFKSWICIK